MCNKAWRRHQRDRWIRGRLFIVNNIWMWGHLECPGKLDHGNLTCSPRCGVCHPWKRWSMPIPERQKANLNRQMAEVHRPRR